jgi:hypothetical protein
LPKFLGMKSPSKKDDCFNSKRTRSYLNLDTNESDPKSLLNNVQDLNNEFDQLKFQKIFSDNRTEISVLKFGLQSILKELKCITQKLKDDQKEEEQSLDWKFAAMVRFYYLMHFFSEFFYKFSIFYSLLIKHRIYTFSEHFLNNF